MQRQDGLITSPHTRPQQLAWIVLLLAFATFCLIATTLVMSVWSYVMNATVGMQAQIFADVPSGVTYQPRGSTTFITVDSAAGSTLYEGYRVRVAPSSSAGYGKVASIALFDGSSLDIRAGTEVVLANYRRTRWTSRAQAVTVSQLSGYVRYNLEQGGDYASTNFTVMLGNGVVVELLPGGSYSVQVRPPSRTLLLSTMSPPRVMPDSQIEVAVRGSGQAIVRGGDQQSQAGPGQLIVVSAGIPYPPVPAQWELIRDINFSDYSEQEYNNTTLLDASAALVRSDTWLVSGQATGDVRRKEDEGRFAIARECIGKQASPCQRMNTAQFIRTGNQTQGFITGITQYLGDPSPAPAGPQVSRPDRETVLQREGTDVSEYRSLLLSADLRILNQSLDKGGQGGTECPLLIRIWYKNVSPADEQLQQVFCFWYKDGPAGTLTTTRAGYFESWQVPQYEWFRFQLDLRDRRYIPDARFLQRIQIEARGHDYNAETTNISLVGTQ